MKQLVLLFCMLMSAFAGAQTIAQEACFPLAQSASGPVAITLWCQIVDYTGSASLVSSWDTGFVTLQRGFSATTLHVEYDPWYSAMDSTIRIELLTGFADVVFAPIVIHYTGEAWTTDIPLGTLGASIGDRIRIVHEASIPHACGLVDNCGMHVTLTFN